MPIILAQRIDIESEYDDVPFSAYHFPRRYSRQLNTGDRFVYYQGNRHKRAHRYYYGCGVIGQVSDRDGASYIAQIIDGRPFPNKVPIYDPAGGFWESLGYPEVRSSKIPPWQNSIRPISNEAFTAILSAGNIPLDFAASAVAVETSCDLQALEALNEQYASLEPNLREKRIAVHLDRGTSVTDALKRLLGPKCQICDWSGFTKPDGDGYIESHHLTQIAAREPNSLCSDNVILVCPNCHRELHYGSIVTVSSDCDFNVVQLGSVTKRIPRNTISFLRSRDLLQPKN